MTRGWYVDIPFDTEIKFHPSGIWIYYGHYILPPWNSIIKEPAARDIWH
jgi:hypothetical protein